MADERTAGRESGPEPLGEEVPVEDIPVEELGDEIVRLAAEMEENERQLGELLDEYMELSEKMRKEGDGSAEPSR